MIHATHSRISLYFLKISGFPESYYTLLRSVLRASDAFPQLPGLAAVAGRHALPFRGCGLADWRMAMERRPYRLWPGGGVVAGLPRR